MAQSAEPESSGVTWGRVWIGIVEFQESGGFSSEALQQMLSFMDFFSNSFMLGDFVCI